MAALERGADTMWRQIAMPAALTLAMVGAAVAGTYATKAEFVSAVAGKTLSTTTKSGKPFEVVYKANGSGSFTLGGAKPASFRWTFKDDTLCSAFRTLSLTECNKVELVDPQTVRFIDAKSGQLNNTYSVH